MAKDIILDSCHKLPYFSQTETAYTPDIHGLGKASFHLKGKGGKNKCVHTPPRTEKKVWTKTIVNNKMRPVKQLKARHCNACEQKLPNAQTEMW